MPPSLAILIDFDGTLTTRDVGDSVVRKFASAGWREAMTRFRTGQFGIRELWEFEISHLPISRIPEMTEYALSIAVPRPGLHELLQYAAQRGIHAEVASNGLSFYVDAVLEANGLDRLVRAAPDLDTRPDGRPGLAFADGLRQCPRTGLCKCDRLWSQRRAGRRVIFVGDGISDMCVTDQADLVIARASLAAHCEQSGIPYKLFHDFFDVLEEVKGEESHRAPSESRSEDSRD